MESEVEDSVIKTAAIKQFNPKKKFKGVSLSKQVMHVNFGKYYGTKKFEDKLESRRTAAR